MYISLLDCVCIESLLMLKAQAKPLNRVWITLGTLLGTPLHNIEVEIALVIFVKR